MATIRLITEGTEFYTGYLFDKNTSLNAKGLLTFLTVVPSADESEEWDADAIAERLGEGISTIRSALRELEHTGYLHREPVTHRGQIVTWIYKIYDMPWTSGGAV